MTTPREPKSLRKRPRWKGLPIPANVLIENGVPDFAAISNEQAIGLGQRRRCGMCGERMGAIVAFIGGPSSMEHRTFYDGPMHVDCAAYAFVVCPYVSGEHRQHRSEMREHEAPVVTLPLAGSHAPAFMAMLKTRRYVWEPDQSAWIAQPGVVVREDELR